MGKAIWIVVGALLVGGGYYAWTQYGGSGVAAYQTEKLADRVCTTILRELKMSGLGPEKAVEVGEAEFLQLAQERIGRTFARDEFKFGIDGKTCKAAIVLKDDGKEQTIRVKKEFTE